MVGAQNSSIFLWKKIHHYFCCTLFLLEDLSIHNENHWKMKGIQNKIETIKIAKCVEMYKNRRISKHFSDIADQKRKTIWE